ncbi:MAG: thioredoxin family protein [Planctomycetaceae bacterium]|jgi:thioredoxin-like negative regulator of GroEL|nr:thioredoxin family protein [Planctomycetaceae bacterium]
MRRLQSIWSLLAMAHGALLTAGCSQSPPPAAIKPVAAGYVAAADFQQLLDSSAEPILVEFGVETGCARCDELRPQVERLADQFSGKAKVRRINLNAERGLAAQLGVTICPTYITFVDGQEAFRTSYPTSGDLIASQLDDSINASSANNTP